MADKYTGEKCIVCGELFEDGQDTVVCPDCGTPYHRSCWQQNERCVNTALHESGESWKPAPKVQYTPPPAVGTAVKCIRCGKESTPGQRFCSECGMPLNFSRGDARPFNGTGAVQPDTDEPYGTGADDIPPTAGPRIQQIRLTAQSDLDGVKLGDFFDYIGNRSVFIITSFVKFAKTSARTSFNIAAFFFPEFYFFYRRMTKYGLFFLLTSFILSIPALIFYGQSGTFGQVFFSTGINVSSSEFRAVVEMCQLLSLSVQIVASIFANYWYYRQARQDITRIRATLGETEPDSVMQERIRGAGGTSWGAVICAVAGELLLTLGFLLIMTIVF